MRFTASPMHAGVTQRLPSTSRSATAPTPSASFFTREDPFTGIDLDACLDPNTGEVTPRAAEIVKLLDSYTEISPSGRGLHIIVRGKPRIEQQRAGQAEIYGWGHYLTFPCRRMDGGR